jgi:putative aldouronate transport system substrate-binding protein
MNKMFRRGILTLLVLAMASSVTGCTTTKKVDNSSKQEEKKTPDKVKILAANAAFEVPTSMDIPEIKYLEEKTNTKIELELLDNPPKYQELVRLRFASGDYPDIYQAWAISSENIIENGLVEDIKPWLDKYPNIKKNIPQYAWDAVTVGGKIVCVPTPAIDNAPAERLFYLRKDWMDNIGIKDIPKTSDELLELYRAFRDKDPNKNGKKDEIAFSSREKFTWIEPLAGMWGVNWDTYSIVDGKAVPGFAAPNTKKVLEYMAQMYKEGLLDSEFLTLNSTTWKNKIKQDRVGSWNHTIGNAGSWYSELKAALPDVKTEILTIPTPKGKGYDGPVGRVMQPVYTTHFIMKESKVKEASLRILDWLASEEGETFSNFGLEGKTLIKNPDGSFTYNREMSKTNKTLWLTSAFNCTQTDSVKSKVKNLDPAFDKKNEEAKLIARKEGIPNTLWSKPLLNTELTKADLRFDGTIIQQGFAKIVFGEKPVDYYDELIASWKKAGGDDIIKEATDWYTKNAKK